MKQVVNISTNSKQGGAALITALVLLTVVTLLALTSMGSNTLEERMASNAQEVNRAFQTAESGLALIMADNNAFDTTLSVDDRNTPFDDSDDIYDYGSPDDTKFGPYNAEMEYHANFRQRTIPRRGTGWDQSVAFYHFDLGATGRTLSGVSTTLHAGAYQVGQK